MKECNLCKTKPVRIFTNKNSLCAKHFSEYFEKKIFMIIRQYHMRFKIKKIKTSDLKFNVLTHILQKKFIPGAKKGEKTYELSTENLNEVSIDILNSFMHKKIGFDELKRFLPVDYKKGICRPLFYLSDEEIMLYAKINKIKGKIQNIKDKREGWVDNFIKEFEKSDPDVRHAIVNSVLKLVK